MARDLQRLYRFAFYGRTASGKSCYLGMLALGGEDQGGLTCEYLPVEVPNPERTQEASNPDTFSQLANPELSVQAPNLDQSPHGWKPGGGKKELTEAEREALGLHKGKEWLQRVTDRLERGELPDPNPPVYDRALPAFDFRLGDPYRGTTRIRLVDYSGELINPALEEDPESFVRKLRDFLAQSDGFLIFAEAPRKDQTPDNAPIRHLRPLREAFASLQETKADLMQTPVCVVLTKWDRWSGIDHDHLEAELQKLQQFLEDHPEYQGLIASVSNALAAQAPEPTEPDVALGPQAPEDSSIVFSPSQEQLNPSPPSEEGPVSAAEPPPLLMARRWSLQRGNTRVFPVSSFGSTRLDNGRELPIGRPRPFGLLQPLLWLAERRDALDMAALQQRYQHVRWPWAPFRFVSRSARSLRQDLARLNHRIPPTTPARSQLAELKRKVLQNTLLSMLTSSITILLILLVGWTGGSSYYWSYLFSRYALIAQDITASGEELFRAKEFFESFLTRSWWNGAIAPSAATAASQLQAICERLEEPLWAPVQKAVDLIAKAEAAKNYLEKLPNGKHTTEAQAIVQQWKAEKAKQEGQEKNRQWLQDCANRLSRASSAIEIAEVLSKLNEGFPAPDYVAQEQKKQRDELLAKTKQRHQEVRWNQFLQSYRDELSQGNVQSAAKILVTPPERSDTWRGVVEKFPQEVETFLKTKLSSYLQNAQFSAARSGLNEARTALKHIESALRPADAVLADSMLKAQQELQNTWAVKIDEQEDQHLYAKVRTYKNKPSIEQYLEHAPLRRMRSYVEKYRDYLERLNEDLECQIELKIAWDKNYHPDRGSAGDNYITVTVDGNRVWQSQESVAEDPGNLSGPICTFPLRGKKDKSFTIGVSILEDDSLLTGFDDDGGSGEGIYTLEKLKGRVEIPLRPEKGRFMNTAVLTIRSGWPEEPLLPVWTK